MTRCETPVVGPWPGGSSLAPQRLMYSAISGCSKFAAKVCEVLGSLSSSSATHVAGRIRLKALVTATRIARVEVHVSQLVDHLTHDVVARPAACQPAAGEKVRDVGDRGDHQRRFAGGRHLRDGIHLDPYVGTVRAVDSGEHASDGLHALEGRGDWVHR